MASQAAQPKAIGDTKAKTTLTSHPSQNSPGDDTAQKEADKLSARSKRRVMSRLEVLLIDKPGETVTIPCKESDSIEVVIKWSRNQLGIKKDDLYNDCLYVNGRLLRNLTKTVGDYRIFGRAFTYRPHLRNDEVIHVRMDDGETIDFIVGLDQKVERIMDVIWDKTGVYIDDQRLLYDGNRLNSERTFAESKVHLGSAIYFFPQIGGRPKNLISFGTILHAPGAPKDGVTRTGHTGPFIVRGTYVELRCPCSPDKVMVEERKYGVLELAESRFYCHECHQSDGVAAVNVGFVECRYRLFRIKKAGEQVSSGWKDTQENQYTRLDPGEMEKGWNRLIFESAELGEQDRCTLCMEKVYAWSKVVGACGHRFREVCIKNWTRGPCPNCELNNHLLHGSP